MAYIRGMRNLGRGAGRTRHQRMLSGGDPPPPPPPPTEYDKKPPRRRRAVATPPSWTPEEQANAARYQAESIAPGIQGLNSFLDRIEETIGGISLNPDFDPWLLNYGP